MTLIDQELAKRCKTSEVQSGDYLEEDDILRIDE